MGTKRPLDSGEKSIDGKTIKVSENYFIAKNNVESKKSQIPGLSLNNTSAEVFAEKMDDKLDFDFHLQDSTGRGTISIDDFSERFAGGEDGLYASFDLGDGLEAMSNAKVMNRYLDGVGTVEDSELKIPADKLLQILNDDNDEIIDSLRYIKEEGILDDAAYSDLLWDKIEDGFSDDVLNDLATSYAEQLGEEDFEFFYDEFQVGKVYEYEQAGTENIDEIMESDDFITASNEYAEKKVSEKVRRYHDYAYKSLTKYKDSGNLVQQTIDDGAYDSNDGSVYPEDIDVAEVVDRY